MLGNILQNSWSVIFKKYQSLESQGSAGEVFQTAAV